MAVKAPHSLFGIMSSHSSARGLLSSGHLRVSTWMSITSWTDCHSSLSSSHSASSSTGPQLVPRSYCSGVHTRVSRNSPNTCLPGEGIALPATSCTHSLCHCPGQDTRGGPSLTWLMGSLEAPCLVSVAPGDNPQKDHSQKSGQFPGSGCPGLPMAIWLHALCHYKGKLPLLPIWSWNSLPCWWRLCSFTLIIKRNQGCLWEVSPTNKCLGTMDAPKMRDEGGGFSTISDLTWFAINPFSSPLLNFIFI